MEVEEVVLLAEDGTPIGTAPKAAVHTDHTPLHLAFSCYVFDDQHRLLVTRRAATKRTWPDVWTNSACGHPGPGEQIEDAVRRRLASELGLNISLVTPVLPDFRYRAVMPNGIVENEICPVFQATVAPGITPSPDPDEVGEYRWIPWAEFSSQVLSGAFEVSPWCRLQVQELAELDSGRWRP
ncbi:isopentenyl-diphosphate Delta-isomerase [Catenulispora sp. NF23]|uniref:Isopentenyl-diphosphate Delta-isomerase n=1 Tax=Catenulispora pinistramenti TaxID=2705254 RepID=A0ABS5L6C4_9ACTN|nr:isopentenyl-diphosphate Delta-isomerase [Catenulispora pinistramenti]MBS2538527.1 isopentenyl-diphosphate Delta-isomerase [Catenulispora pinistramenti]MBS2553694.1 isopentenyl-diphosphate Delta-isomerase [Catenulispora pinistramenti]